MLIQTIYDFFTKEKDETETKTKNVAENKKNLFYPFKLPIHYLEKTKVHPLTKTIRDDLELDTIIYDSLFSFSLQDKGKDKKNSFGYLLKDEWGKQITTDISFLLDSQTILQEMAQEEDSPVFFEKRNEKNEEKTKTIDSIKFMSIWADLHDQYFLDKYFYIDWKQFMYLNESSVFLQFFSMSTILSPLISIFIPIIILIIPFIILKFQGIAITCSKYIEILKDTAKHHFIGKSIVNIQSLSFDKLMYLIITMILYVFQIHQNINMCMKYYKNIQEINGNLLFMKDYISTMIDKMELFVTRHKTTKKTYTLFCQDIEKHVCVLKPFLNELNQITTFSHSLKKPNEIGQLLKCYYYLMNDENYSTSLQYSIGFEAYIDNITSISQKIKEKTVVVATYDTTNPTSILQQYNPSTIIQKIDSEPHTEIEMEMEMLMEIEMEMDKKKSMVKNNVSMASNIIITGPNASGKTTLLKTTTINIILSQQFGCGFYTSCQLNPYHHIHSYLNIPDTSERDSLFQAESRRCKDMLTSIHASPTTDRHFCIFDELYSGTNPLEAKKAGYAFLTYLSNYPMVDFILTTHYIGICKKCKINNNNVLKKKIINYKMDTIEKNGKIHYTYKSIKGISKIQGAIHVFEEMEYPEEILHSIR